MQSFISVDIWYTVYTSTKRTCYFFKPAGTQKNAETENFKSLHN